VQGDGGVHVGPRQVDDLVGRQRGQPGAQRRQPERAQHAGLGQQGGGGVGQPERDQHRYRRDEAGQCPARQVARAGRGRDGTDEIHGRHLVLACPAIAARLGPVRHEVTVSVAFIQGWKVQW
jgi:hypothetical protein